MLCYSCDSVLASAQSYQQSRMQSLATTVTMVTQLAQVTLQWFQVTSLGALVCTYIPDIALFLR